MADSYLTDSNHAERPRKRSRDRTPVRPSAAAAQTGSLGRRRWRRRRWVGLDRADDDLLRRRVGVGKGRFQEVAEARCAGEREVDAVGLKPGAAPARVRDPVEQERAAWEAFRDTAHA